MVGIFFVFILGLLGLPEQAQAFRTYSDIEWPEDGPQNDRSPSQIEDYYDPDLYDKFSSEEDFLPKDKISEKLRQNARHYFKKTSEEISSETKTILNIVQDSSSSSEQRVPNKFKLVPFLNGPHFSFEAQLHNYFYPKGPEAVPEVGKPLENEKNCTDTLESVLQILLRNIQPRSDETTALPATTVPSTLQTAYIPEYILGQGGTEGDTSVPTAPISSQISGEGERIEVRNLEKVIKNSTLQSLPSGAAPTDQILAELIRYAKNHTDILEFIKLQLVSDGRVYKVGAAILGSALPENTTTGTIPPVTPTPENTTEEGSTQESITQEITTSESSLPENTTPENELTTDQSFESSSDLSTTQSSQTSETSQTPSTTEQPIPSPTPLIQPLQRRRKRHVANVRSEVYNQLCHLETDLSISSSESTSNSQSLKTVQSVEVGEMIDEYLKDEKHTNLDTEILNIDPIVEHIHAKFLKKEKKPYEYEKLKHKCNNKIAKPPSLELELSIETEELIEHPPPFIKSAK